MKLLISDSEGNKKQFEMTDAKIVLIKDIDEIKIDKKYIRVSDYIKPDVKYFRLADEKLDTIFNSIDIEESSKYRNVRDFIKTIYPSLLIYSVPEYFQLKSAITEILDTIKPDTILFHQKQKLKIVRYNKIDKFALIKAIFINESRKRNISVEGEIIYKSGIHKSYFVILAIAYLAKEIITKLTIQRPKYSKFKNSSSKKIIFFNHALPHSLVIKPILTKLEEEKLHSSIIFDTTNYTSDYKDYFKQEIKVRFHKIFSIAYQIFSSVNYFYEILNSKINSDCEEYIIRKVLSLLFIKNIAEYVCYKTYIENIIKTRKPDLIVNTEDRGLHHRLTFLLADKFKIPSVLLQCGLYGDLPIYEPEIFASKFCVEGIAVKELIVKKLKHPEEKIVITGQPKYEWIKNQSNNYNKKFIQDVLKIFNPNKSTILIATSNIEENPDSLINKKTIRDELEILYNGITSLGNYNIIIKPHPMERLEIHKKFIEKFDIEGKVNLIDNSKYNLYDYLFSTDYLLTRFSTVGIEALAAGKILLIYGNETVNIDNIYLKYKVGTLLKCDISYDRQIEEAKKYSESVAYKENLNNFLFEYCNSVDGKATDNIITVFNSLLNN